MNKQEYINYIEHKYYELEENSQNGNQIFWTFTNYPADFYENIKSAKIFSKWKLENKPKDLPTFFKEQAPKYKLARGSEESRRLIIDKLYGLITCNYSRGYDNEDTTTIYDNIIDSLANENTIDEIISEQVLKVKINPIAGRDKIINRSLYPIIFTYQVLRELLNKGITSISLLDFYIIICTQKKHSDVSFCVELLSTSENCHYPEEFTIQFLSDKNRILGFFDNINLFIYNDNKISININFIDIMDKFLENHNGVFEILDDINIYKTFLCSLQNFDISLIGESVQEELEEYIYSQSVEQNIRNISDDELNNIINNYKRNLAYSDTKTKTKITPETQYSTAALQKYEHKCCANSEHHTFTSKSHGNPYMEAHHLIPRKYQQLYFDEKHINIDCVQNIVSLCPNCHRTLHHGIFAEKEEILKTLYELKKDDLLSIGIDINFDKLMSYYI